MEAVLSHAGYQLSGRNRVRTAFEYGGISCFCIASADNCDHYSTGDHAFLVLRHGEEADNGC